MLRTGMAMTGRGILVAVAAITAAMWAPATAGAQAALSERIARTMSQGQSTDLQRRFGRALVDDPRDLEVDPAAGVGETRRLLVRRAAVYEKLKDTGRAESDLTSALQLAAPTPELYVARGY